MTLPAEKDLSEKSIVLYDGVCGLCKRSVKFILYHDKRGYFSFAALQSSIASRLLGGITVSRPEYDSIILIEGGKLFFKSEAALRIARNLGFPWKLLILFRIIPLPLRDKIYDFIARNRYKWFGKDDKCLFIEPKWKERFLDLAEMDNY